MKRIFRSLAALLIIVISFSAISFAWLASGKYLNFPSSFGGSATPAYFAGGDGSFEKPFRITNAVHLYNLAWLQYLGYFNRREGFNNGLDQTYFALDGNIDMRGRAIPPIGTEEYPFIGKFNGNGHKVTNLTISNKKGTGDLVYAPTNAKFSNNILRFVDDTKAHDIEIVGMFGVTGNYNKYLDTYANTYKGLNKADVNVTNFYVDKIHVRSNSAKTLAGLAAGYIGGNFSNVGVYRSDIKFAANAQANGIAGDGVLSKYSLVGAYNEDLITWDDIGGTTGWGGSIDMKSLFTRLQGFKSHTPISYVDKNFNDTNSSSNIRYYDEKKGSVYFTSVNQGGVLYLYGGKIGSKFEKDTYINKPGEEGFYISSGSSGYYLTLKSLGTYGTDRTNDINNAVTWFYNSAEKSLYTYVNGNQTDGRKKYLNMNSYGTLTLSDTSTVQWEKNGKTLCTSVQYSVNLYTYYLYYSSYGYWSGTTTPTDIEFTSDLKDMRYYSTEYIYRGNVTANNTTTTRNFATYIPLLTDNDGNVINKNTGYIASGSTTVSSGSVTGDVRVREISLSSALKNSLTNNSSYEEGNSIKIYTRTANSNGFVSFTDAYGSAEEGKKMGLVKYENAKTNFDNMFNGSSSKVYGMHFMNAPISIKNVYTADYAMINGDEYTDGNYQMVANSIDFKAKKKGHINFFSGTYYNGADKNFFSLHEVKRNGNNITEIKSISKIYAHKTNSKADYIYLYDNNTYSGDYSEENYELAFDVDWIINPEMNYYSVYYFEIPVNAGEYALGSASTGDGAYLMYLDIGANGNSDGTEENYTMDKVRFVNSGMPSDGNGNVNLSAYEHALITLSGSSTAEEIAVFKRDEQETDGKLKLAYRIINNNANAIKVNETTTGMTRKDTTLTPSTDDD